MLRARVPGVLLKLIDAPSGRKFDRADLAGASIILCTLQHSNFLDATLTGILIEKSNMEASNFVGARLSDGKFIDSSFMGTRTE